MLQRIGKLFLSHRQLIPELSRGLCTLLTRLNIAMKRLPAKRHPKDANNLPQGLERIHRKSKHICKLLDDTMTLYWLGNETPKLKKELLDLMNLFEVLVEDASFKFPDRSIAAELPITADVSNTNHRDPRQAPENILYNALRYTPARKTVSISLEKSEAG